MLEYKRPPRRLQAKCKEAKKSQDDRRKRLQRRNPPRKKAIHVGLPLAGAMQTAVPVLQAVRTFSVRPPRAGKS
jgi:hypothetical protein